MKAARWAEDFRRYEAIRRLIERGRQILRWRTRPGTWTSAGLTLYWLVDIYNSAGTVEAFQPEAMRRRAGTRVLPRKAEEIIERAIRFALGSGLTPRSAGLKLTANLRSQRVTVSSQNAHVQQISSSLMPRRPVTRGVEHETRDRSSQFPASDGRGQGICGIDTNAWSVRRGPSQRNMPNSTKDTDLDDIREHQLRPRNKRSRVTTRRKGAFAWEFPNLPPSSSLGILDTGYHWTVWCEAQRETRLSLVAVGVARAISYSRRARGIASRRRPEGPRSTARRVSNSLPTHVEGIGFGRAARGAVPFAIRKRRLPGPDRKGLTNRVLNRLRKRRGSRSLAG